jgi:hypothetical protein
MPLIAHYYIRNFLNYSTWLYLPTPNGFPFFHLKSQNNLPWDVSKQPMDCGWLTHCHQCFSYSVDVNVIDGGPQQYHRKGWDRVNRFNNATMFCLSHTMTWISNVICGGLFYIQWVGGIVDHCFLNFS